MLIVIFEFFEKKEKKAGINKEKVKR